MRSNMCRSIKTLANFEPPATDTEIRAAATQFVRKLSGASRPSRANEVVFDRAVDEVTAFYRVYHSSRMVGPDFVIRLNHPLPPGLPDQSPPMP